MFALLFFTKHFQNVSAKSFSFSAKSAVNKKPRFIGGAAYFF